MGDGNNRNCNNTPPTYQGAWNYYTIDNVEENSLPKIPCNKLPNPKPSNPYGNGNGTPNTGRQNEFKYDKKPSFKDSNGNRIDRGSSFNRYKYSDQPGKTQKFVASEKEKKSLDEFPLPWYLKPFISPSLARAEGRLARIMKLGLKNADGKKSEAYIIFLMHQMVTGAIGGILMGIETGYITLEGELPASANKNMLGLGRPPDVAAPSSLFRSGAIVWRTTKRAFAAAILFNFIEKSFEESRSKSDWRNSAYTGAICGGLYGLRGGATCAVMGSLVFGSFAGLSGKLEEMRRRKKRNK